MAARDSVREVLLSRMPPHVGVVPLRPTMDDLQRHRNPPPELSVRDYR
jgi:hypothetical protein